MVIRDRREKEKSYKTSTRKEDKELLMVSHKEVKKVKHMHKPLYIILPINVCSLSSQFLPLPSLDLEKLLEEFEGNFQESPKGLPRCLIGQPIEVISRRQRRFKDKWMHFWRKHEPMCGVCNFGSRER